MKFWLWLLLISCLFAIGCHSNNQPPKYSAPPADTSKFYSLDGFYRAQIEYVDLRNFSIRKITSTNGKKDSAVMTKEQWVAMASKLFPAQQIKPKEKAMYRESVFEDQSTDSYTLNYTAQDPSVEVRSVDILLNRQTNIIKRVFVKSVRKAGGDTIIEQVFSLKADKSMQLNRTITANGKSSTELNYIKWNE